MSETDSIKDLIIEEDVDVNVGDSILVGPQGPEGIQGIQGPEGKSAYEVAVENGFEGTEEEWLASLKIAIDDSKTATDTTWSSYKIEKLFYDLQYDFIELNIKQGSHYRIEENKAIENTTVEGYGSAVLDVIEGEIYKIKVTERSNKTYGYIFTDEELNVISYGLQGENTQFASLYRGIIEVPSGATKMFSSAYFGYINIKNKGMNNKKNVIVENIFKGLKLSLLGDSISSYIGTIPEGNKAYYTGSNAGVSSSEQMWWKILCDELEMIPLVINGWSGSTVTNNIRDNIIYKPSSDISRCQELHNGNDMPDIILIAMGVNDYSYNANLGTWDGTTELNDDVSTFRSAYATMLKRIQIKYPNSVIICISPWFVQRGIDKDSTYVNNQLGLTENNYSNAIKDVANIMNCSFIDGTNIGFNRYNYYPKYCIDNELNPTHPNSKGQEIMGTTIAQRLKQICNGFIKSLE